MKKLLLFALGSLAIFTSQLNAQCTGGPDAACVGSNGPCGTLDPGTVGQAYNDTISFWAPNQVDATAQSGGLFGWVDFVQFQIANISGLPAGLTWSCGNGSCIYNPQPSGILANFNICGTPFVSGTFNITVDIIGTVYLPGLGNQTGPQQYIIPLVINANSGGNAAFNFSPSQACDSALVDFNSLMNFPLPQITTWLWDFGGGNTYNGQTPPDQNYTTPGIYPVTCTTSVYNMVLTNFSLNVCGQGWWCGDIEELNCGNGNADLIPTFSTGVTNWTTGEVTDNCSPAWTGITYVLTSSSFSISMIENDPVSADDIPPIFSGTVTNAGTYNFNYPGYYSGSYTIALSLVNQFIVTDTVLIYATPPMDTIVATSNSFCPNDSVTLSVYPGYFYQWFMNDTVQVQTGNNNTYTTSDAGTYSVVIVDPVSGCSVNPAPLTLTTLPIVPPGFGNVGITETPPGTYHSVLPAGYTYQWVYFDGINYSPIPAPAGTSADYTPSINGIYCLIATNTSGCSDTSNCIGFHVGVEDMASPFLANVYPNPTDGLINITIANLTEDATLNVYNMVGQQVYSVKVIGNGAINEQHDLSFLNKGLYILELQNKQNRYTHKLIIE